MPAGRARARLQAAVFSEDAYMRRLSTQDTFFKRRAARAGRAADSRLLLLFKAAFFPATTFGHTYLSRFATRLSLMGAGADAALQ